MSDVPQHLVIITGMSGAGKSYVQSTLEDLGFYCSDNLPTNLIMPFIDEVVRREGFQKVGIVTDVRASDFAERFPDFYRTTLKKRVPRATLIFMEATDEVLVRRFSETRRPHPLGAEQPVLDAIRQERQKLLDVKSCADLILDTSQFSVHELKSQIMRRFQLTGEDYKMLVTIISFGFKYSIPYNPDLLFDVRFLPNPHFVEELRPKTGLDSEVIEYLRNQPDYDVFFEKLNDFIAYLLPMYGREMKSYLTIGIGCTGGKHRSVAITERLAESLRELGCRVQVVHRDCAR